VNTREQSVDIVTYIFAYIRHSSLKRSARSGGRGLAVNTLRLYNRLGQVWSDYKIYEGLSVLTLDELNRDRLNAFTFWLLEYKKFALNYVGQLLKMTKTIARDAVKSGYKVHLYINHIESFTQPREDRRLITFTPDDIIALWNLKDLSASEENHRRWLLLGLHTGQRVSDLFRFSPSAVRSATQGLYLDFLQQKTGRSVTVGIKDPRLIDWLTTFGFELISPQAFNYAIKKLAKRAGITSLVEGYKLDLSSKRKRIGKYPKYELVSSHIMRRSFATNHFGKVPTPLLMEITGHTKETTFLSYIGRSTNRDHYADAFMDAID
jgi:integrase